jgi:flagellar hook assembly protein FlgD
VRTLVDGARAAGSYQVLWDGRNARGAQVSSGVYFYRLQAGDLTQMRRMLLLK